MKILLTGVTGYIGKRLLPVLVNKGYRVICCVRDKKRLTLPTGVSERIEIVEIDFLTPPAFDTLPSDFSIAYYLIHSMSSSTDKFFELESKAAKNFAAYMEYAKVKQVIYLSGISNVPMLSKHLTSRKNVEEVLSLGQFNLTVLRAGIVVGSGSASFEIIRDIVEKLPVIIAPSWVNTKSQPIAVRDVITYLVRVLYNEKCYNRSFDIGGPEVLTYKEILRQYADVRGLKRHIFIIPFLTPKISSYWLFFITSVSFKLASNLVDSMKMEIVCRDQELEKMVRVNPMPYRQAIKNAFVKIAQNLVASSWKDSLASSILGYRLSEVIEVPSYGCYKNIKKIKITDTERILNNIWSIGGDKGYYYATWLWKIRGFFDLIMGGVGLNRGRKLPEEIHTGDALDFWRVLYANRKEKHFLLFAEMKIPGEAWLEFKIDQNNVLYQIATFRPKGIPGRFYWIITSPAHFFVFNGMIRNLAKAGRN